ncbi:MAG: hypothetical protein HY699_22760 [Deltaproteobacteria bacterium]|nr:hypothetical protein [Deltaproteobacteria bacterium]
MSHEDQDPLARLPHRHPFLLLDRVLLVEPRRWAVGVRNVTRNDPLVDETGVLAPVVLAEIMAQLAGLAGAPAGAAAPAVLARLNRFRCRGPIVAGDRLLVAARVARCFGANVVARAAIRVSGRPRAAAELVLHFQAER